MSNQNITETAIHLKKSEAAKLLEEARQLEEKLQKEKQDKQLIEVNRFECEFSSLFHEYKNEYDEKIALAKQANQDLLEFSDKIGIPFTLDEESSYFPEQYCRIMDKYDMANNNKYHCQHIVSKLTNVNYFPYDIDDCGWMNSSSHC